MKALRLCSYVSLLGVLLITGGCEANYVAKGNEQITKEAVIKDCAVTPYTAAVFTNDVLTWKVDPLDTNTYTVTFTGSAPISAPAFPVKSSAPAAHTIKKTTGCMLSWNNCYYSYTLTKGQAPCPDPGVHIIPGP